MSTINIGIIGAGRIGKLHAENLYRVPQVEIKTISDIYTDSVTAWAANFRIKKVTKDYQDILDDPDIRAVFICSSTNTHAQIIIDAAMAGKHIFCEKPISFEIDETVRALEVVKSVGVKFQAGFNRRFDANFQRIHDFVREGKIGKPHIIKVTSRDPEPPTEEYIKVSGGMFIDMSIHDFDIARYVAGSDVEEVYAQGAVLIDPVFGELGDVDTAVITLKFKNGAIGIIDNSRETAYGYDQRVEVFGSKGCVTVQNDFPNSAELMTQDGVYRDNPKYFFLDRYKDAYIKETRAFIAAIVNDGVIPVDGNDGLQAELIAHAAKRSLNEKRPIRVEEVYKEAFIS